MSKFGVRILAAQQMIDAEFGDLLTYTPMRAVVNGEPVADGTRAGGTVRAILVVPGSVIGAGFALSSGMHDRSTADPMVWYLDNGVLANVQKHDIFKMEAGPTYLGKPRRFEVIDGPEIVGFGRWKCKLVELPLVAGDAPA